MFGLPGGIEWVILAVVALLVFGGSRLSGVGKNAGKAIREFREETSALRKDAPKADEKPSVEGPAGGSSDDKTPGA